jgi:CRP-like cAMP-binding protein
MLFVEGEPPSQFYVVLDGWVRPFRQTGDGRESVIALFARGESFAEAVMFLPASSRSAPQWSTEPGCW